MDLLLSDASGQNFENSDQLLDITGSKSESNRLLILQKLHANIDIKNLSASDDSRYLKSVLDSEDTLLDIGHAGTAMRFGTAYFASQVGREVVLTGSDRMKQRPIGILVEALKQLGADIEYMQEIGFPPLRIYGKKLEGGAIHVDGSVSSQFLTALLLTATSFTRGLQLKITNLTSVPYLRMTYKLLKDLGFIIDWEEEAHLITIRLKPTNNDAVESKLVTVESDWSSAGYWFSWVALQPVGYQLSLNYYKEYSLQGDSLLKELYKTFGVASEIIDGKLTLTRTRVDLPQFFEYNFIDIPDQAQTVFATCIGLGVSCKFTGLHTLKVKETDRIEAMKIVGSRFRESDISTTDHSIILQVKPQSKFKPTVTVDTFQDHRMAMAFAPLCLKTDVQINDANVVSKSYAEFWDDLKALGVGISKR